MPKGVPFRRGGGGRPRVRFARPSPDRRGGHDRVRPWCPRPVASLLVADAVRQPHVGAQQWRSSERDRNDLVDLCSHRFEVVQRLVNWLPADAAVRLFSQDSDSQLAASVAVADPGVGCHGLPLVVRGELALARAGLFGQRHGGVCAGCAAPGEVIVGWGVASGPSGPTEPGRRQRLALTAPLATRRTRQVRRRPDLRRDRACRWNLSTQAQDRWTDLERQAALFGASPTARQRSTISQGSSASIARQIR